MSSLEVHGMGRELVAPDWPPLTADELAGVVGVAEVLWRSPRPLSAAALVRTPDGDVFVKRHANAVRDAAALAEEHAFGAHLRAAGIPVPAVLGVVSGEAWTYEVHAVGNGEDTYRDVPSWEPLTSSAHAVSVGRVLAEIACAATGFDAPARPPRLLVSSWGAVSSPDLPVALEGFVQARPLLARALSDRDWRRDVEQVLVPLHAHLRPHLPDLQPSWTHGDGHGSNLLWQADDVTAVLDLGLCDRTTPLLDLATAIERQAVSWLDGEPQVRDDLVDGLLAGWSSVRPIDGPALAALLPLAHVEFALSELAYFAGITGSAVNADLAHAFVFDHARWFGGRAGQALLARLARC
ncbi:MAG: hypothetical protein JWN77_184 [Frankiales bacterium]|jgi:Ser/Thr protein kinase RdoA (MazF antagonist)|nr:hypothetical protein [Frankiales bacterium]